MNSIRNDLLDDKRTFELVSIYKRYLELLRGLQRSERSLFQGVEAQVGIIHDRAQIHSVGKSGVHFLGSVDFKDGAIWIRDATEHEAAALGVGHFEDIGFPVLNFDSDKRLLEEVLDQLKVNLPRAYKRAVAMFEANKALQRIADTDNR